MNRLRSQSNIVRVGIYRDIASPDIDINSAVVAVDNLQKKFGNIALAETHRLVQLTNESKNEINVNSVNWVETSNHLNFVLTNRQIVDESNTLPKDTFVTVGMSVYRSFRKPYAIVDTVHAPHLLESIVQHELAHLVKVKDSGTYYDHEDHCNHPKCLMQPIAQKHLNDFCAECSEQLDERILKLSRLEIPGANLFRKALRFVAGDNIKTVRPIDEPLEHNWI